MYTSSRKMPGGKLKRARRRAGWGCISHVGSSEAPAAHVWRCIRGGQNREDGCSTVHAMHPAAPSTGGTRATANPWPGSTPCDMGGRGHRWVRAAARRFRSLCPSRAGQCVNDSRSTGYRYSRGSDMRPHSSRITGAGGCPGAHPHLVTLHCPVHGLANRSLVFIATTPTKMKQVVHGPRKANISYNKVLLQATIGQSNPSYLY